MSSWEQINIFPLVIFKCGQCHVNCKTAFRWMKVELKSRHESHTLRLCRNNAAKHIKSMPTNGDTQQQKTVASNVELNWYFMVVSCLHARTPSLTRVSIKWTIQKQTHKRIRAHPTLMNVLYTSFWRQQVDKWTEWANINRFSVYWARRYRSSHRRAANPMQFNQRLNDSVFDFLFSFLFKKKQSIWYKQRAAMWEPIDYTHHLQV